MASRSQSARTRPPGTNRFGGLQRRLWAALALTLALPAAAILWGGAVAAALVVPATPAMAAHLLVGLAAVGVKRRQVAQAIAAAQSHPKLCRWRLTPRQWGSFALSKRRGLASACAGVGVAHGAATLALILGGWDGHLRALPWGAALSLSALAGLAVAGFYADLLLGRFAPVDTAEDAEVWLSPVAVCFNGDAVWLRGGGCSVRAVEERPGPPAWLVIHIDRPDGRTVRLPVPVPNDDAAALRQAAASLGEVEGV